MDQTIVSQKQPERNDLLEMHATEPGTPNASDYRSELFYCSGAGAGPGVAVRAGCAED